MIHLIDAIARERLSSLDVFGPRSLESMYIPHMRVVVLVYLLNGSTYLEVLRAKTFSPVKENPPML